MKTKQKFIPSFKGRKHSAETLKMNKENWYKHHPPTSEETRFRLSEAQKRSFQNNPDRREAIGLRYRGKKLSEEHCTNLSKSKKGMINRREKHALWNGGTKIYRDMVFGEYGFVKICNRCGETEKKLVAHHIDEDRNNNKKDNFEVLCSSCHRKHHCNLRNNPKSRKRFYKMI